MPLSAATSRSKPGRIASSTGAGQTTRSIERTTGRPPLSSRLKLPVTRIGLAFLSGSGSDTWAWPCASSWASATGWRVRRASSSTSPNTKPGHCRGRASRWRSLAACTTRRLPAAGAPYR
jgi:hypothetical protein